MTGTCQAGSLDSQGFFMGPASFNLSVDDDERDERSSSIDDIVDEGTPSPVDLDSTCFALDSPRTTQSTSEITGADRWISFGSIRLASASPQPGVIDRWLMIDSPRKDYFPHKDLFLAERRRWLRMQTINHASTDGLAIVRIYLLPEDVERSARASVKELRRILKWLLTFVDTSYQAWIGLFETVAPPELYDKPSADQDESLFYIFNTLDSPKPQTELSSGSRYVQESMSAILFDTIPGLKTDLYSYQKRSVAVMLQREEMPARSVDQRKPAYRDLDGDYFHMDVFEGIITQDPQLYAEPKGGIFAETMGYGKTLACLALILATRGHYPAVPEGLIEEKIRPSPGKTTSLLSMAARLLVQNAIPWKAEFHALKQAGYHYDNITAEISKYHREFAEPIFNPTTPSRRVSKRESERMLRLCFGTLVIVPPNLVGQWQSEIAKHLEPDALDVLVIGKLDDEIPPWYDLMRYDLVLMAKNRLEKEYKDNDHNEGRKYRYEAKYRSPLTEVRWLRIICDEGHDFAGSSGTHAMTMLAKMSVERRWIISGTPSGSVYGVEVNLAAAQTQSSPRKASLKKALEERRLPDSVKQEIKDIEKLRQIIVHFLRVQPWANQKGSDHASWRKHLAPFDTEGNRRSAPGLRPLLQSLIVRHRIEELDVDAPLPRLHNKTVYLEPSYYDKMSLNLFVLVLAVNAVTSERTDEDYMFHRKNRKELNQLISNLRQSTFHWVGFGADRIVETLREAEKYLDNHLDTISDADACLLTEGMMNGERALDDPGWRAFSTLHEIGVYVESFPGSTEARQAWSVHGEPCKPLLLGTTQARAAQQFIRSNMDLSDPTNGIVGAGLRVMNDSKKKAEQETKSKKEKVAKTSDNAKAIPAGVAEEVTLSRSSHAPGKLVNPSLKRRRGNSDASVPSPSAETLKLLHQTKITGFTSAKLTYLCAQLLQYSTTSKSIVFYDSGLGNIAFWLAEALDLLAIPHQIYASGIKAELRSKYLRDFNTNDKCRVLIMDLKQASLGLHVAAANRVYIVSPIWSTAMEAQAIKRAHRIGQTNEVWVETLVLKGTVEEKMWLRRKGMTEKEMRVEGKGSWVDDEGVRDLISSGQYSRFDEKEEDDVKGDDMNTGQGKRRVRESAKVCKLDVPQALFFRRKMRRPEDRDVNSSLAPTTNGRGGNAERSPPPSTPTPMRPEEKGTNAVIDVDADQERVHKKRKIGGVRFNDAVIKHEAPSIFGTPATSAAPGDTPQDTSYLSPRKHIESFFPSPSLFAVRSKDTSTSISTSSPGVGSGSGSGSGTAAGGDADAVPTTSMTINNHDDIQSRKKRCRLHCLEVS